MYNASRNIIYTQCYLCRAGGSCKVRMNMHDMSWSCNVFLPVLLISMEEAAAQVRYQTVWSGHGTSTETIELPFLLALVSYRFIAVYVSPNSCLILGVYKYFLSHITAWTTAYNVYLHPLILTKPYEFKGSNEKKSKTVSTSCYSAYLVL